MESLQAKTNPLSIGIKQIGIGKKNSKSLTKENADAILNELKNEEHPNFLRNSKLHIQLAALLGALLIKKPISKEEEYFLIELIAHFSKDSNIKTNKFTNMAYKSLKMKIYKKVLFLLFVEKYMQWIPTENTNILKFLLKGKPIKKKKLQKVSHLFFQKEKEYIKNKLHDIGIPQEEKLKQVESYKAYTIANMRYRYVSITEYKQFYDDLIGSLQNEAPFLLQKQLIQKHIANISEPFDGVNKNLFITPIISHYCLSKFLYPIQIVGVSSGPKLEMNLLDVAKKMEGNFITDSNDIYKKESHKTFCDLTHFSTVLNEWQKIRKYTIKRPFLATLEKFPRIFQAEYFISSAFHDNFCPIMLEIAEHAGYEKIIIVHKGREGTLGLSLSKPNMIYLSKRKQKGKQHYYQRKSFACSLRDIGEELQADGRVKVSAEKNVEFIDAFLENKTINSLEFITWKARAIFTQIGIKQAMDAIDQDDF